MSHHPLQLYSEYSDGRNLSPAEIAALRDWVNGDEQDVQELVDFALINSSVTDRLELRRLLDDLTSPRSRKPMNVDALEEAIAYIEAISPLTERSQQLALPEPESKIAWFASAAALTASVATAAAVWWLFGSPAANPGASEPVARQVPSAPLDPAKSPQARVIVGKVAASFDAEWPADHPSLARGQSIAEGSECELTRGVVQFALRNRAIAVVEGPSRFAFTGSRTVSLMEGKIAVRAEGNEPFTVDTPRSQVIDLGTEFGVQTSLEEERVAVFEGVVALAARDSTFDASSAPPSSRLEAGFEASAAPGADAHAQFGPPQPLLNDRFFVRPDEIEVRQRAAGGSREDQRIAAHYARRRIEGLLAYQGFDEPSSARERAIGFRGDGLVATGDVRFLKNSAERSDTLAIRDGSLFMLLDCAAESLLAAANCVADSGRLGRTGTELWVTWRERRLNPDVRHEGWAGTSFMFGDVSWAEEAMFLGRGQGVDSALVVQSLPGAGDAENLATLNVDADVSRAGIQPLQTSDDERTWVVRLQFEDHGDRASIWANPDLSQIDVDQPQATLNMARAEFDRIRFEVKRQQEEWQFEEFAMALRPEALAELERIGEVGKHPGSSDRASAKPDDQ